MKIAYFSPIYYNDLKQRPQHIAEILSESIEIYYIEPTISLMKFLLKGGENFKGKRYEVNGKLHVIRVNGLMTIHKSLEALDFLHLNVLSEKIQLKKIIKDCDVIWVGYPGWYYLIRNIKDKLVVYDKMDDNVQLSKQYLLRYLLKKIENNLINKADIVVVTCQQFYNTIKPMKENTILVRNGFPEEFIKERALASDTKKEQLIFGYIGTISFWFDYEAIKTILSCNPNYEVVIVGRVLVEKYEHKRIRYIGEVSKNEIPYYINSFDVCLYPFRNNSLLDTINPVKIYEYLIFNKPVIAVKSVETVELSEYCLLYNTYEDIYKICKELKPPFVCKEELDSFINKNSWRVRVIQIIKSLSMSYKK